MKIVNLRTSENRSPGVVPKLHSIFEGLVKLRPITLFFRPFQAKRRGIVALHEYIPKHWIKYLSCLLSTYIRGGLTNWRSRTSLERSTQ